MKSFSATVTKDLMLNRLFKIVLTKCSFAKPQSCCIGVQFSCVKLINETSALGYTWLHTLKKLLLTAMITKANTVLKQKAYVKRTQGVRGP